jgi:hypothetical protein
MEMNERCPKMENSIVLLHLNLRVGFCNTANARPEVPKAQKPVVCHLQTLSNSFTFSTKVI